MKTKTLSTIVASAAALFAVSSTAHAVLNPGWERPVQQSMMRVSDARDAFANVKEAQLVMTQQDGHRSPTGFLLLIDNQVMDFVVADKQGDDCGSLRYIASPANSDEIGISRVAMKLALTDHTMRICKDYQPDQWQAVLSDVDGDLVTLSGQPEAVMTIQ